MIDTTVEPYGAKVIADSMSTNGTRLTTMVVSIPRFELPAFNTHRVFSRNSASSRAIPVERRIDQVEAHPYVPLEFGKNKRGMQHTDVLEGMEAEAAREDWLKIAADVVAGSRRLASRKVHKQLANRVLEPFLFQPVLVTATEWENFFALRLDEAAQAEIRLAAESMKAAMDASCPRTVDVDDWHLPLVDAAEGIPAEMVRRVCVGRCARVSTLTFDGRRDPDADVKLHDDLLWKGHMSPFEHAARPMTDDELARYLTADTNGKSFCGNFNGWIQYRKLLPGEAVWSRERHRDA